MFIYIKLENVQLGHDIGSANAVSDYVEASSAFKVKIV